MEYHNIKYGIDSQFWYNDINLIAIRMKIGITGGNTYLSDFYIKFLIGIHADPSETGFYMFLFKAVVPI